MPISLDNHHRLARFSPEARRILAANGATKKLVSDATLFLEGQSSNTLHFVLDGILKLNRSLPNGRDVLVDLLGPGDVAGEAAVLAGLPHFTSAQARGCVTVFSVEKEPYLALVRSDPQYFALYLEETGNQVLRITRRLTEVMAGRAPSRLAYLLLMLDERFGDTTGLRLLRRELAEMTGMRLESAIRALRVMEARNLVSFQPHGVTIEKRKCLELVAYLGCDCDSGECPLGAAKNFA